MKLSPAVFAAVLLATPLAVSAQTPAPNSLVEVQVTGAGKPPVIFIPGLATPGAIWDDTVAQFKGDYTCYVVSIAGFGGKPPVKTAHFLADVTQAIIDYAQAHHLEKPAIVGHSLGGVLATKIAIAAPGLPGRLVLVDSLPFLAGLMAPGVVDAVTAKPLAAAYEKTLASQIQQQFADGQKEFIGGMITSPQKGLAVAAMTGKSDPATTGQAMGELIADDLRPDLSKIKCPVFVLGALADKVAAGNPRDLVEQSYRDQYKNLPGVQIEFFEHARHFIMVDDPAGFNAALRKDLASK